MIDSISILLSSDLIHLWGLETLEDTWPSVNISVTQEVLSLNEVFL